MSKDDYDSKYNILLTHRNNAYKNKIIDHIIQKTLSNNNAIKNKEPTIRFASVEFGHTIYFTLRNELKCTTEPYPTKRLENQTNT